MNVAEYRRMYEHEQRHFWFRGTRSVVFDQVRDLWSTNLLVADVGCGTGGTMSAMPEAWRVCGIDFSQDALQFTHSRGHRRLGRASAEDLPLKSGTFGLAFALDVVEHCDDDAKVVSELFRILKPGGRLVCTVPAYPLLFGPHDRALHHRRRYRRSGVRALLADAGFQIQRLSYFNTMLFGLSAPVRLAQRLLPSRDGEVTNLSVPVGPVNAAFARIFAFERFPLRQLDFPFGLSVLAVAQRPG